MGCRYLPLPPVPTPLPTVTYRYLPLPTGEVFQELPVKVRNSHLSSALLLELQDECGINANAADFDRLELHTNPFLEKQMQVPLLLPLLLPFS